MVLAYAQSVSGGQPAVFCRQAEAVAMDYSHTWE